MERALRVSRSQGEGNVALNAPKLSAGEVGILQRQLKISKMVLGARTTRMCSAR